MGITSICARVSNLGHAKGFAEVEFIVDSGAVHSVVPRSILEQIGVETETTERFYMSMARASAATRVWLSSNTTGNGRRQKSSSARKEIWR